MTQLLTDEIGQAFEILQENKSRIRGNQCISTNITVVKNIANFISTSFGPTGMDKILQSKDDEITVTNDGATILKEMDMTNNPISQLILQLSESQDQEIGDGTTGVVILASALLQQADTLLSQGVHPVRIAEGFDLACNLAIKHLETISQDRGDLKKAMINASRTSLNSKVVSKSIDTFADICTEAVLSVADMERFDVDFDLINIEKKTGKDVSETQLVKGIVINKDFSHPQMRKVLRNAKIALLACPFEPPKLKNKHSLIIKNSDEYRELQKYEKETFLEMISFLKASGTDLVMCQWGFDDEANSLLMENDLPAIRWVGGNDLDLIAVHIGANIISRFEDLTAEDLGTADVKEMMLGTESNKIIVIENFEGKKAVSIVVRGANDMIIDEAKRSIEDALYAARNVLIGDKIVYGGGSSEISMSLHLEKCKSEYEGEEFEMITAFSRALEAIPITLSRNSGFDAMDYLSKLRNKQIETKNDNLGVDCLDNNEEDMKKLNVFDTLKAKTRQMQMATQLVNTILKIDDIIFSDGN